MSIELTPVTFFMLTIGQIIGAFYAGYLWGKHSKEEAGR